MLVDACNGLNELIHLAMLWTVHQCWPAGARFVFNCYINWAQLLLRQTGDAPVIILSQEGVTQGDPLFLVLYGTTLVPLAEERRDTDPTVLSPLYTNDAVFDESAMRSAAQLRLLMDRGPDQGYFYNPAPSLLISDNPEEKEAAVREFDMESLNLNYTDVRRYLGAYLGHGEKLEEWVQPKVEA